MDRICGAILNKIRALSPAGHYVIVDEDELYEAFPEDCERTDDALERALSALKGSGYIDLKYSRGEMYCVAPLKEYIEESPPPPPEEQPVPQRRRADFVFVSAFLGSALGSLIVSVIFAVI